MIRLFVFNRRWNNLDYLNIVLCSAIFYEGYGIAAVALSAALGVVSHLGERFL